MSSDPTHQNTSFQDIAIDFMDQGLLVVAPDLSVPVLNFRAIELLDLPAEFATDRPSFPDILAYQVETGAITSAYRDSSINGFILRGEPVFGTHTYTRKTVTGRWLDVRTRPMARGGFVRTFTDQTERHNISQAKRQSDTAYRALFENAAIGIYRSSAAGEQLRANPELVALNGYHSEHDMLQNIGDIAREWYVDPERRKEFQDQLFTRGRVTEFESEVYRHLTRERIWVSETAWAVRDDAGDIIGYEGTVVEITERKKLEGLINHAAHHDALTGLPNRAFFNQALDDAIGQGDPFFLAYIDLDGFKAINDTHGHGTGDELLAAIGARFSSRLRRDEPVFRMGGDEFAVILRNVTLAKAQELLGRLIDAVECPFKLGDLSITVGVSIGLAASTPDADASDILNLADTGLYRSKTVAGSAISVETAQSQKRRRA